MIYILIICVGTLTFPSNARIVPLVHPLMPEATTHLTASLWNSRSERPLFFPDRPETGGWMGKRSPRQLKACKLFSIFFFVLMQSQSASHVFVGEKCNTGCRWSGYEATRTLSSNPSPRGTRPPPRGVRVAHCNVHVPRTRAVPCCRPRHQNACIF